MSIDDIIEFIDALGGVLVLRPREGDGSPEIAWGDVFFYYAPDGVVPNGQPFATAVTKDYPDDRESRLDRPGAFRLNISAGRSAFLEWAGHEPRETATQATDPSTPDVVIAHPVYGELAWLAVVDPGPRTETAVHELLRSAHDQARTRYERRSARQAEA